MKRLVILLLTVLYFCTSHAQAVNSNGQQDKDALLLKETDHDFGNIPQGKPVYYYFDIVNNTGMPLKLDRVQASCGCTTPEWNKEAIPAGGTDKIKVGFNAAVEGNFEKQITITFNETHTKILKIKGIVWKAPAGSAPANASVQFLKQQIQ